MQSQNTPLLSVSVIVPVTKPNKFLERCIDSLISQTLKELEIILVDGSQDDICQPYLAKDKRINIIKSSSSAIAACLNSGINSAKGNYIGFVKPVDWVEPEMFEEMLRQADKNKVEVVSTLFYVHEDNKDVRVNGGINNDVFLFNTKINDLLKVPNYYLSDSPFFVSIYSRDFINSRKITFQDTEHTIASFLTFNFSVYSQIDSLFIYRASFYHYDNSAREPLNSTDVAKGLLEGHLIIYKIIKALSVDKRIMNIEAARCFRDINNSIDIILGPGQKVNFLKGYSSILREYIPLLGNNGFLSKSEKKQFREFALYPLVSGIMHKSNAYVKALSSLISIKLDKSKSYIRIFGFPVIFLKRTHEYMTFNVFNISILRTKKRINNEAVKTKFYFLYIPFAKKTVDNDYIKLFLLNIMVFKKINIKAKFDALNARINRLPSKEDVVYFSGLLNTVSATHTKIFPKFKNSNIGKNIAILATGPSMKYAPKIRNSKTIACNRAFEFFMDKEPDYIFAEDFTGVRDFYDKLIERKTEIFLGSYVLTAPYHEHSIPEQFRNDDRLHRYFLYWGDHIRPELDSMPLSGFATIVHTALHFALYTNPDNIYILGCDTSNNGYANKNIQQTPIDDRKLGWIVDGYKKLKDFRDLQYPNTKIISVNPIGLRGLFDDVYTEGFLENNSNVETRSPQIVDEI